MALRWMALRQMATSGWRRKHERTLDNAYGHAPYWNATTKTMRDWTPEIVDHLATYTSVLIRRFAADLGITTGFVVASDLNPLPNDPIDRIRTICRWVGATEYLSPAGARDYLEGHDIGVPIRWHDYRQTEHGNIYRHSANCKCVKWEQPPVQLDDDGPDTTVLCW